MVIGMATKKITITLPVEQVDRVRELVEEGSADSISGFVKRAVGAALDDLAVWRAVLAEALEESGGPLSPEERDWADDVLSGSTRSTRPVA